MGFEPLETTKTKNTKVRFSWKQHNMNAIKPDFVSNYYKTSTFSFLSTNKAKLQQKVAERAKNGINPNSTHGDPASNDGDEDMSPVDDSQGELGHTFQTIQDDPKVILHVDMVCLNSFFSPFLFSQLDITILTFHCISTYPIVNY